MSMGAEILASAFESLSDAVASCRKQGQPAFRCICTGLPQDVMQDDNGQDIQTAGMVRFIASEEPQNAILKKDIIEVKLAGQTTWRRVRVYGRNDIGGAVRLTVAQEQSGGA